MISVVFAMSGSVFRNSRALKQIQLLSDNGHQVNVLDIRSEKPEPNPDIRNVTWRHLKVDGSGPLYFRNIHRQFLKESLKLTADVFHASDLYVLSALRRAASRNASKLVYDSRELYPYVASTRDKPWSSLFWSRFEAKNIKNADLVFTVSQSISDSLKTSYPTKNPIVLWNIPSRHHSTSISSERSIRADLQLALDKPLILHQGQMKKSRGCDKLIEAMPQVAKAHCAFLGGGPYKEHLQNLVNELGIQERVHFLAPVPTSDLIDYTRAASIGVSLLEDTCLNHRFALPNKLFEYLMAGLPVLAADLPEISKVVSDFNVGMLADSSSPTSIAERLNEMLADPERLRTFSANTEKVFETMNWEIAGARFIEAYESLFSTSAE